MPQTEQKLGEEAQARLDAVARQHEDYVRQLRDRLLKEREDAVEKERIAAADRLRDVNERWEGRALGRPAVFPHYREVWRLC